MAASTKKEIEKGIIKVQEILEQISLKLPEDAYACIKHIYDEQDKIQDFVRKNKKLIENCVLEKVDFDILKQHPILGNCQKRHAYFCSPLYKHVKLTEPQLTIALAQFFNECKNQNICKAFLQAVFEILNKPQEISTEVQCSYEICTAREIEKKRRQRKKKKRNTQKRIDNLFIWGENLLCVEIKFDAKLTNQLEIYQNYCKNFARVRNIKNMDYVVISKEKLQKQINRYIQKKNNKRSKNKLEKWSNILWVDLLKKWEEIIIKQNFDEDLDMRRYRTSLWYKVLNKEA